MKLRARQSLLMSTQILYTHQFGTIEKKQKLASKLLGVHADACKEVFNKSASSIPCVYLFTLGTVKELRGSMAILDKYSDDLIICK